jgi:hypothetical protein
MAYIASTTPAPLPDGESSPTALPGSTARPDTEENSPMLVDLLALIPACLAGIGGAFLGDKVGAWFQKTRASDNG